MNTWLWFSAKWNNRVLKVVLGCNVSAQNYKTIMSFFATSPNGSISSGYLGTSRLASHPLSTIQHHENGQSWSHETTLSSPPPHIHTRTHTHTHTRTHTPWSIAFPFWPIKVAVVTWRNCIIYFSNNFQNEWKLFVYCSSETKDGIMLTTPSMHLRY